jgi:hypothetical protein
MKSIERNFRAIERKNPWFSSLGCFTVAIMGKKISTKAMRIWFYKLVEKDDYAKNEKKEVLEYLESVLKPLRTE